MTPVNPPYCLQAAADKHPAQLFRQAISTLLNPNGGLVAAGGLAISQKATPNMSVEILGGTPAEGGCWIAGTSSPGTQGLYYCLNNATYNLAIAAAGASNPRVDTIIARVKDEAYEGSANEWVLEAVKGAEESGVTLANRKGVGAVPASSLVLGYVLVPAKATTIVTADIENTAATVGPALAAATPTFTTPKSVTHANLEAGILVSNTHTAIVQLRAVSESTKFMALYAEVGGVNVAFVRVPPVFESYSEVTLSFPVPAGVKFYVPNIAATNVASFLWTALLL